MKNARENNLKTFEQWSAEGYLITRGSKAKWVDRKPMFSESQVKRKAVYDRDGWESATDENCSGGPMFGIYGNCD